MAMYLRAAILQATVLQGAFIWAVHGEIFAKTVLLHCRMEEHIRREGWHDWGKREAHDTLYFAEAGSTGPGAVPEERPEWVRILSEDELEPYSRERVLGGNDGWMSGR